MSINWNPDLSLKGHLSGSSVLLSLNCFGLVSSFHLNIGFDLDFLSLVEGTFLVNS